MKKTIYIIACTLIALVYLISAYPVMGEFGFGPKFDSPDETANYFWVQQFANQGTLVAPEPGNQQAQNQIHPRSINVRDDGSLVPGSFLGMILLLGIVAKLATMYVVPFVTPVLSLVALVAWYNIVKKLFDAKVATVATWLVIVNPAWWYFAIHGLFPNTLFVSLVVIASGLLLSVTKQSQWRLIVGCVVAAVAVTVRTAEVVWVAAVVLTLLIAMRQQYTWKYFVTAVLCGVLVLASVGALQQAIYGSALATGYSQLHELDNSCQLCSIASSLFIPFGFHPRAAWNNFWQYFATSFWPLTLLAAVGVIVFISRFSKKTKAQKVFLFGSGILGIFLTLYYGSWLTNDAATLSLNTISIPYYRYWLPLILITSVFAAITIEKITSRYLPKYQAVTHALIMAIWIAVTIPTVYWQHDDSVFNVRQRINQYHAQAQMITSLTGEDAVVITSRKDKVIFPQRRVMHTLVPLAQNQTILESAKSISGTTDIYYWALDDEKAALQEQEVIAEEIKSLTGQEVLYKLSL